MSRVTKADLLERIAELQKHRDHLHTVQKELVGKIEKARIVIEATTKSHDEAAERVMLICHELGISPSGTVDQLRTRVQAKLGGKPGPVASDRKGRILMVLEALLQAEGV